MLAVRFIGGREGGAARESKNEPGKKGTVRLAELPGKTKIAPRLLAEIGDDRERFDGDVQNLQCLAGTAPVTKRSGKYRHCHQRWACDKHLRHAIHLFAEQSLSRCAWAQTYYQHHRQKDRSHANALRRLGHRWLKIISQDVDGSNPIRPRAPSPQSTPTRLLDLSVKRMLITHHFFA